MTAVWLTLGFVAGIPAGWLWREAYELIRGRDDPMALWKRIRANDRSAAIVAVILSMVFCGGVGIYLAVSNNDRADLVRCISDYNEAVGAARDSRSDVADDLGRAELDYLDAELRYQRGLLESLEDVEPVAELRDTITDRIAATEEYRQQARAQQDVRDSEPYPSPTYCEDEQ
ncbi:hypothetical protein GCM10009737_08400 [Nocardioides lentus]|uniref:SLATT domain-containing protein n=1 Tax=Nocardioides lentus TaxID=338077 RepID=A0ABN2P168_9ACTN